MDWELIEEFLTEEENSERFFIDNSNIFSRNTTNNNEQLFVNNSVESFNRPENLQPYQFNDRINYHVDQFQQGTNNNTDFYSQPYNEQTGFNSWQSPTFDHGELNNTGSGVGFDNFYTPQDNIDYHRQNHYFYQQAPNHLATNNHGDTSFYSHPNHYNNTYNGENSISSYPALTTYHNNLHTHQNHYNILNDFFYQVNSHPTTTALNYGYFLPNNICNVNNGLNHTSHFFPFDYTYTSGADYNTEDLISQLGGSLHDTREDQSNVSENNQYEQSNGE